MVESRDASHSIQNHHKQNRKHTSTWQASIYECRNDFKKSRDARNKNSQSMHNPKSSIWQGNKRTALAATAIKHTSNGKQAYKQAEMKKKEGDFLELRVAGR